MRANQLIINHRYVPIRKTVGSRGLKSSEVLRRARGCGQPYLYYVGTSTISGNYIFSDHPLTIIQCATGDYFRPGDVISYKQYEFIQKQKQKRKAMSTQTTKSMISIIRESIAEGFLPEDWAERKNDIDVQYGIAFIPGVTGHASSWDDTVIPMTNDPVYSEALETYIRISEAITVISIGGATFYDHVDNFDDYNKYEGKYYDDEGMEYADLVIDYRGRVCDRDDVNWVADHGEYYPTDMCFYWECDGEYHLEPEYEDEDEEYDEDSGHSMFQYNSGPEPAWRAGEADFCIGFEIEKNARPSCFGKETARAIFDRTGWVIERDGSVDDGFEAKTPVYDLYDDDGMDKDFEMMKEWIEVENIRGAGGHINFSKKGMDPEKLLDKLAGWLPLIYALYHGRIGNQYCKAKSIEQLKGDREKYQSVMIHDCRIEFRIVSAVRNVKNLKWRIKFFQIMSKNLGKSFASVLQMAINPNTNLGKHLREDVYMTPDKMIKLLEKAVNIAKDIEKYSVDRNIIDAINKISK